ncbi:MAG: hypothetical protein JWO57_160 [Pseudonocardiales bacterium]|nr:hypothetical protein [Pseudonocardiales bacterium]
MTSDPAYRPEPTAPRRLPVGVMAVTGVLLAIPLVALALVPTYAKDKPRLWGFPFFYWYQLLWVFLAAACTYTAYVLITRARRGGDQ